MRIRCGVSLAIVLLVADVSRSQDATGLRLEGELLIPAGTSFASVAPSRFGAISGLAALPGGCELLAISDDDVDSRFYRLRLRSTANGIGVEPLQRVALERASAAPAKLDPEGIALTRSGTVLISSEGIGGVEPRLPPAILEYAQDGRFIRQLPVPTHFVPNQTGPLRMGVRRNGGFESLTVTADFTRLFTANELPLVQDGPADAFSEQRVRIVEYTAGDDAYRPVREFAYDVDPLEHPTFASGFSVNGVAELLAVNGTELFALERGFVQMRGSPIGINRVRLFRISLDGATDVASFESLAGRRDVTPVRKTLVQDLSKLSGLPLRLLNLENFEGLAWAGSGEGADRSLLVVSDDNFNALQVTAFLLLEPAAAPKRAPVCP